MKKRQKPIIVLIIIIFFFSCTTSGTIRNPELAQQYFMDAQSLVNNWDFEQALNKIQKAISLDSENAVYIMFEGTYRGLLGDRLAALHALDRCIEMEPDNPRFYNNRASSLAQLGFYKEAYADIDKFFSIADQSLFGAAYDTLAWIHFFAGTHAGVNETFMKISEEFPEGLPYTFALKFKVLQKTKGIEYALQYGHEVLEMDLDQNTRDAINLLMGNIDIRDIEITHVFWLGWYMMLLRDYEYSILEKELPEIKQQIVKGDRPVLLIRDIEAKRIEESFGNVLTDIIRSSFVEQDTFRIIDDTSRLEAIKELKVSLSGLTAGDVDIELGKFLIADYILAGSITAAQGQFLCNIAISSSETAELIFSRFFVIELFEELEQEIDTFASGIMSKI